MGGWFGWLFFMCLVLEFCGILFLVLIRFLIDKKVCFFEEFGDWLLFWLLYCEWEIGGEKCVFWFLDVVWLLFGFGLYCFWGFFEELFLVYENFCFGLCLWGCLYILLSIEYVGIKGIIWEEWGVCLCCMVEK